MQALLVLVVASLTPTDAVARHRARLDPTEPVFTRRAFVQKDVELDVDVVDGDDDDTVTFTTGAAWAFDDRYELSLELPWIVRVPESGPTVGGLGDVAVGTQIQLCCEPDGPLDFFSIAAEVDTPTGDRARGLDGDGAWSVSLLPARDVTVLVSLPDLTLSGELTFARAIRHAAGDGRGPLHAAVEWNLALAQQYLAGRLRPVLEMLGTSVVQAPHHADVGTAVDLAVGVWAFPFADDHPLSALGIALGWRFPVTGRHENDGEALLIFDWGLD
jgi:hypothetical protein